MYIVNNIEKKSQYEVLSFLPLRVRENLANIDLSDAYEIHLGVDRPICICFREGRFFISDKGNLTRDIKKCKFLRREDIEKTVELITEASVYSLKDEMVNGFITVYGGHRIGISGSAVIRDGELVFLKDISSLNIRIANEIKGVSNKIISDITDGSTIKNTLFISPPGAGKTTILRDVSRNLSNMGFGVGIVDERCEIAGMHNGRSRFDLGVNTDVLSGIKKSDGMDMMLRTMSPQAIVTDEIGNNEDFLSISQMLRAGVSVITSIHGRSIEEIRGRKINLDSFDVFIILSKVNGAGTIERIIKR